MSNGQEIIKNFGMSVVNCGKSLGQAIVLVLKLNGELFYLDPCDQNVFSKSTLINSTDGSHLAWRLFDSFSVMQSFIAEHRVADQSMAKLPALSESEILANGYAVS